MSKTERDKGARGQREAMALIVGFGADAVHRGAQGGAHDADPDLRVEFGRWKLAVEVKRRERLDLPGWWRQAVGYAAGGEDVLPVVMWRRSREEWLAAVRAETLMGLLGRLALKEQRFDKAVELLREAFRGMRLPNYGYPPSDPTYSGIREFLHELGGE